jgi:predicted RNase H-like nuclease
MWVAGVDGCRGGWIVAVVNGSSDVRLRLCRAFQEVLDLDDPRPDVIAIDIPIGLLETPCRGGRICDRQARRELGIPRGSSVFTPPLRGFLTARSFSDVNGMSIQAFGILKKVAEVDSLITPALQQRIHEAHPELAFRRLAGHSMRFNKKGRQGRQERVRALTGAGVGFDVEKGRWRRQLQNFSAQAVGADDLLDAYALASTALRIAIGEATRVPPDLPCDRKGLRMEIWY